MPKLKHTYHYSPKYSHLNGLCDARADVYLVPGGFVFKLVNVPGAEDVYYGCSSACKFNTVEDALLTALQFVDYPDVAEYSGPLDTEESAA